MNATSKLVLRNSYQKKDGTYPINLRVTINRESKYYPTKVSCKKDDWIDSKQRIKGSVEKSGVDNLTLSDKETKATAILDNFVRFNKIPTIIEFTSLFNGDFVKDSFYELAQNYIKNH
ncbi:Arm DNA-binding domain-containing protein [Plebeiibacterium sediminum]|uniref:Arm DNA-binding domain-containing protein n=1 Tax=Plebeiibacterium sediminum TaxID=2992112 RepID=A0AAE3M928_9BACT|nr:Arm DNA-binding domain-containing protein [Plebeiobacterium sediminum]MCW3788845.1 Arm DNA-binding domain-containing protein [Plebeiobacterium sediminum]